MGVHVLEMNLRSSDSEVKAGYEYYYTKRIMPGQYARLFVIAAMMPNRENTDTTELGVYDGAKYMAVRGRTTWGEIKTLVSRGEIWIAPRERVYLKTTGAAVDNEVRLHARGLSCSSLPTV